MKRRPRNCRSGGKEGTVLRWRGCSWDRGKSALYSTGKLHTEWKGPNPKSSRAYSDQAYCSYPDSYLLRTLIVAVVGASQLEQLCHYSIRVRVGVALLEW